METGEERDGVVEIRRGLAGGERVLAKPGADAADGVGTTVAEGKRTIDIDGRTYLLEMPLRADFALVNARQADHPSARPCREFREQPTHSHARQQRPAHRRMVAGRDAESSVPVDDARGFRGDGNIREQTRHQARADGGAGRRGVCRAWRRS